MAQAAVSDVAGQWLLAGRSEKTMAGGSSIINSIGVERSLGLIVKQIALLTMLQFLLRAHEE